MPSEPVELSWSYYPARIAQGTPLDKKRRIIGGAPQALSDLGYPQRDFVDRLSTRPPTSEEIEGLELPEEVPVIRQFRVIYSDNAVPVEVSIIVKGGHLYELKYKQVISS
ncbi:UTRA domain-containing protein [Nonomuraea ferruginea]